VTGSYSQTKTSSDSYTMTETCPAYTLSESGTNQATTQETGNSLTADYSRSITGSDTYTLTESGTNAYGSYSETVAGSDAYTQTETGNTLNQTFSRSTSGTGTYTRQESGPGASQGPWSDSLSYTLQETGDWRAGVLSQSETGCDRYGLLEQFDNVSNTASGAAPGHLNFSPFGMPFSDDPPADETGSPSLLQDNRRFLVQGMPCADCHPKKSEKLDFKGLDLKRGSLTTGELLRRLSAPKNNTLEEMNASAVRAFVEGKGKVVHQEGTGLFGLGAVKLTVFQTDTPLGGKQNLLVESEAQDNPAYSAYMGRQTAELRSMLGPRPDVLSLSLDPFGSGFQQLGAYNDLETKYLNEAEKSAPPKRVQVPLSIGFYGDRASVENILKQRDIQNSVNGWQILKDDVFPWIPLVDTATQIEEGLYLFQKGDNRGGTISLVLAVPSFIGNVELGVGLLQKGAVKVATQGAKMALKEEGEALVSREAGALVAPSGAMRFRSIYQGGPYQAGRFGRGGTIWDAADATYRSGQVRAERIVHEAGRQLGVDVHALVDEIVYVPGAKYPFYVEQNGRRILALNQRAVFGTDESLRLLKAAHELGHARVASNAALSAALSYEAEEVLVESQARAALAPNLSRRALRNSLQYENDYRALLGLSPLPVPP